MRRGGPVRTTVALLAVLLLGVGIGVVASRPAPAATATPADSSPEAGFARDMSTHHAQAVTMADTIRARTEDPALVSLATDMLLTQQAQIGQFSGWLEQWDLPASSLDAPMAWVDGHSTMGPMAMPGLATNEEIRSLATASVEEAEVEFLVLMIRHHQGGVDMARAVLPLTERTEVTRIATAIVDGQTSEIAAMQEMLDRRTSP